jgi:class 3 adenylate cyclase/Flp pilus assembly protein TadD
MNIYFAAIFTDLVRQSVVWNRVSRDTVANIMAEHRYLSQSLASQYGRRHENFTGDGHLYLFDSADAAVHFALKLIAYWKQRRRSLVGEKIGQDLPIRVGCHFGECSRMADEDAWIGRAINIAKRVESTADPDKLFVTQTILELIDLPIYDFSDAGDHELKGDFLPRRPLYRLSSVDRAALAARPEEKMTAEDWFLRGVGLEGGQCTKFNEELECYQHAIRLRSNYPEAHNNLGILLKAAGDTAAAAQHYQEALRLWPQYPEAHYNYAMLLERLDRPRAEEHYRAAIRAQPGYAEAHNNLAALLHENGELATAEEHYLTALRLRPSDPETNYNLALLAQARGDDHSAEQYFRRARELTAAG